MSMPPMNALRAFEAVARNGSFKRAADELHVTPAAVSHQIKTLEDFLGFSLLDRDSRTLSLTPAGRRCYPGIHAGFESIRLGIAQAQARGALAGLAITAGPAFVSKWLAPRLAGFAAARPEIDTRIVAGLAIVDLEAEGIDVAIRFGDPRRIESADRTRLSVERLVEESVTPLVSPNLASGLANGSANGSANAADLAGLPLIHDDSLRAVSPDVPDWAAWLSAAAISGVDPARGLRFSNADHALQAAMDGAGIVLGRRVLAAPDIAAGRLLAPFPLALSSGLWFHFVTPLTRRADPAVAAFAEWMREQLGDLG